LISSELTRISGQFYNTRVSAIALVQVWYHPEGELEKDFKNFLLDRGRMWKLSRAPLNVPIDLPGTKEFETGMAHTPVFSGGVPDWADSLFPVAQSAILAWMEDVAADIDYCNPEFEVFHEPDEVEEEEEEASGVKEEEASRVVEEVEAAPDGKTAGQSEAES
jgi:hypothetical protein